MVATGVGLVACAWAGCEVDTTTRDASAVTDAAADSDTTDAVTDTRVDTSSGYTFCNVGAVPSECPADQFCETTASVCVDCVGFEQRCTPDGRETCLPPRSRGIGLLDEGGFFEPDPCGSGELCVQDGIRATCEEAVCTPGRAVCTSATTSERCDSSGTSLVITTCDAGSACYDGSCQPLRHNVMLVFDTSGSMYDYIDPAYPGSVLTCEQNGTPCVEPFPVCEDPADPLTLFTRSKRVFADSVIATIGGFAQFALARFPQRESGANAVNCSLGWYLPNDTMTGDDNAYATVPGGWFDQNRGETLVVPFPVRNNLDNRDALLEWLDFEETLSASDTPCLGHGDCGTGRCGTYNGEKRCFYHGNDELRAGGATPLGKSLFYAGEYFRRSVRVDGKPCTSDISCGSSGYACVDDVCRDPYRACRDDFIILFTDGEESEHPQDNAFFNPVVQAQRLAFGLECAEDADCRGGATCEPFAVDCKGNALPDGTMRCLGPGQDVCDVPVRVDSEGHPALSSPDGQPISIRTTVITLERGAGTSVNTNNQKIARAGGGVHLDVEAQDRDAFRATLMQAMSPNFKCAPEDLPDRVPPAGE